MQPRTLPGLRSPFELTPRRVGVKCNRVKLAESPRHLRSRLRLAPSTHEMGAWRRVATFTLTTQFLQGHFSEKTSFGFRWIGNNFLLKFVVVWLSWVFMLLFCNPGFR